MTGFSVEPESFSPVAAQLRTVAGSLQSAWEPVRAASSAVHFGSGTDLVSPLIQVSLAGAISLVDSCIRTSTTALHGYADGLERMGASYANAEQDTTAVFRAG